MNATDKPVSAPKGFPSDGQGVGGPVPCGCPPKRSCRCLHQRSADKRNWTPGRVPWQPGFDPSKKYPLVPEIHGGPFANYGPRWSAEMQAYAAAGYVVVYANPRGSTSYGADFGNLIHHNYPGNVYDDLMSVLTAWIVGKTDRFRAAVVAKPVINWTSFALTADSTPYYTQYWFPAFPWEAQEHYWKRSPLSLVGNVKTPTMLLTGEADYRTPMSETEQYYQALKLRRVDTAMVRIPEASHGMASRPTQLIGKTLNILAWFEKYRTRADKVS